MFGICMFEDPELEAKILRDMATATAVADNRDLVTDADHVRAAKALQIFSDTLYTAQDGELVFKSCRTGSDNDLPEADM